LLILGAFVLSVCACGAYLRLASSWQLVDHPNHRSSHQRPTPHGGGLPLMLAFVSTWALASYQLQYWPDSYLTLMLLLLALTVVGVVDDLRGLAVGLRFALYSACCAMAAWALIAGAATLAPPLLFLLILLVALALLWHLNLYNFMDGIDGIAAVQCILACMGIAWVNWTIGGSEYYRLVCLLLAASQLGFLAWNLPPARLFMGDAGSIPTGFVLAGLAVLGAAQGEQPLGCWILLLAVFIVDASWTLGWRILSGQKFAQAHRSHAYQRLSRHWGSHLAVDGLLTAIVCLWLLPLAYILANYPELEVLLVILGYVPLLLGMVKLRQLA